MNYDVKKIIERVDASFSASYEATARREEARARAKFNGKYELE